MSTALAVIWGAGPVGLTLGKEFLSRGVAVRLVTRSGRAVLDGASVVAADVSDRAAALEASKGATILVHAVGSAYPLWARELPPLQDSALAVAEATGAVVVFVENLYSYTADQLPLTEASSEVPPTRKGALRLRLSQQWLDAHRQGRVRAVAVRASDYFGPGATRSANSHLGSRFFPEFEAGKPVAFLGNPDARHSYTYLPDYARALADVALDPTSWGRSWISPSVAPTSARAMAERFAAVAHKPVKVGRLPRGLLSVLGLFNPMLREVVEMLYQFERDFVVDASAFEAHFGWKATDVDAAVRATWQAHVD